MMSLMMLMMTDDDHYVVDDDHVDVDDGDDDDDDDVDDDGDGDDDEDDDGDVVDENRSKPMTSRRPHLGIPNQIERALRGQPLDTSDCSGRIPRFPNIEQRCQQSGQNTQHAFPRLQDRPRSLDTRDVTHGRGLDRECVH